MFSDDRLIKYWSQLQIPGARLGISEHPADNSRVFEFALTEEDRTAIEAVLELSNGRRMITTIGDCGAEYR